MRQPVCRSAHHSAHCARSTMCTHSLQSTSLTVYRWATFKLESHSSKERQMKSALLIRTEEKRGEAGNATWLVRRPSVEYSVKYIRWNVLVGTFGRIKIRANLEMDWELGPDRVSGPTRCARSARALHLHWHKILTNGAPDRRGCSPVGWCQLMQDHNCVATPDHS